MLLLFPVVNFNSFGMILSLDLGSKGNFKEGSATVLDTP